MTQWWKAMLIALFFSSSGVTAHPLSLSHGVTERREQLPSGHAEESTVAAINTFSPTDAQQASWVFSGIVTSESGEDYGYFFQLERNHSRFRANVALMDQARKTVLFQENSDVMIEDAPPFDWHVGHSFLRFNPVNDSWIFGVKRKDNLGFNFKVDMLKQFEVTPSRRHHLRPGVMMMVSRTSELNGHVLTGASDSEQFVTTKESWFRQIWQDTPDSQPHDLSSVLCQFNDGSRLYSANLQEPDAQSGAIAGWYNPEGNRQAMSQFLQVYQDKGDTWHIKSQSPHLDLALKNVLAQQSVVAGFVDGMKHQGFCMLNRKGPDQSEPRPLGSATLG